MCSAVKGLIQLVSVLSLVDFASPDSSGISWTAAKKEEWKQSALEVFYHGYDSYMQYAFPHDELKPITKDFTDSLGEFGNPNPPQCHQGYQGVALTLIDSLSTLAVLGNQSEFEKGVWWVVKQVSFDVDLKVNVFEANIRLLGGLLSAHLLASDESLGLMQKPYHGELLVQAADLGARLMAAFEGSPSDLPYAWVNLHSGVGPEERAIDETNTAAVGSFTLEMGLLSRLTGDPSYERAAVAALSQLWSMRSPLDLVGTSINMQKGHWNNRLGGTGAGADSFYEYLLKAYILFGRTEYWDVFQEAYRAVMQNYRSGPWYDDADIVTGSSVHQQFQSLQAFWPGMQVLAGDLLAAQESYWHYFALWKAFGALPERFLYSHGQLHSNQHQYALRPELMESTFYLYQATQDTRYLGAGAAIIQSLYDLNWVDGGWASLQSVHTRKLEDAMPSYFLAEACKYLYLLFDDSFLQGKNYIFTTEGHIIPVLSQFHKPGPANAQLQKLVKQPATPLRSSPAVQTVIVTPDQTQLWQLFQSVKEHFSSRPSEGSGRTSTVHNLAEAVRQTEPEMVTIQLDEHFEAALMQEAQRPQGGASAECDATDGLHGKDHACLSLNHAQVESAPEMPVTSEGCDSPELDIADQPRSCRVAHSPASDAVRRPHSAISDEHASRKRRTDALNLRVCPAFVHPDNGVVSLCHVPDVAFDSSCRTRADCGVDSVTCRDRVCSVHGFCWSD